MNPRRVWCFCLICGKKDKQHSTMISWLRSEGGGWRWSVDRVATGAGLVSTLISILDSCLAPSKVYTYSASCPRLRSRGKVWKRFSTNSSRSPVGLYRSFATESPTCSSTLRKSFHSCLSPPPELKNRQRNVLIHSLAAELHNSSYKWNSDGKDTMSYTSDWKVFNIISHLCMCCVRYIA